MRNEIYSIDDDIYVIKEEKEDGSVVVDMITSNSVFNYLIINRNITIDTEEYESFRDSDDYKADYLQKCLNIIFPESVFDERIHNDLFYIKFKNSYSIITRTIGYYKEKNYYNCDIKELITFNKSGKIVHNNTMSFDVIKNIASDEDMKTINDLLNNKNLRVEYVYGMCYKIIDENIENAENGAIFIERNNNREHYFIKADNEHIINYSGRFGNYKYLDICDAPVGLVQQGNIKNIKSDKMKKIFRDEFLKMFKG